MSESSSMNDLDRAILAFARSKAALPEVMRRLGEGDLWFLVPYQPEVEGEEVELKNGMALPFSQLEDAEGPFVPLFSSFERTREAMKKSRFPARTFSAGSMPAKQVLAMLGKTERRAVLNRSCATGHLLLPANLMRDVADGSAFRAAARPAPQVRGKLHILSPAEYPTALVQPAIEFLRQHRNFRAAWIFERGRRQRKPAAGRRFQILLLMEPRDAAVFQDFSLVVNAALASPDGLELGYLNENDPAFIASLWQRAPAFYVAPDYTRPPGTKE